MQCPHKDRTQKYRDTKKQKIQLHCQRHDGLKAFSTLTHSTPTFKEESLTSFKILVELHFGFCLAKGNKHKDKTTLTNTYNNLNKSM